MSPFRYTIIQKLYHSGSEEHMFTLTIILFLLQIPLNSALISFPGLGVDLANKLCSQALVLFILVIITYTLLFLCSYLVTTSIRRGKSSSTAWVVEIVIYVLLYSMSIYKLTINPYIRFIYLTPHCFAVVLTTLFGILMAKRKLSKLKN